MRSRRFVREEQGAVLVEFGMVVPLFLIMFCAMFDFALVLLQVNALATAARDGARFASVIEDVVTNDARVQQRTADAFNALSVNDTIAAANVTVVAPTTANGGRITVTIPSTAYAYTPIFPLASMIGISSLPMGRAATFKSEWLHVE